MGLGEMSETAATRARHERSAPLDDALLREVEALGRAAVRVAQALSPEDVLDQVAAELREFGLGWHFSLLAPEGDALVVERVSLPPDLGRAVERLMGITIVGFRLPVDRIEALRSAVRERRSVMVAGDEAMPQVFPSAPAMLVRQLIKLIGIERVIIAPLLVRGKVLGALTVWGRDLRPELQPMVAVFAHQVATAYENAHLLREAELERDHARRARADLERFVALLAHEIRAPLAAVRGFSQLERRRGAPNPQAFERIEREVDRVTALTENVLDAARLGSGRVSLRLEPADLGALVHERAEAARAVAPGREIAVHAASGLVGDWDSARLRQVIDNLLRNALAYSSAPSRVTVAVVSTSDRARVNVRDEGRGLAEGEAERLFKAFSRLEGASEAGTGLGLYVARVIVEAHGGRIWAESPGLGRGTTFSFELPCTPPAVVSA